MLAMRLGENPSGLPVHVNEAPLDSEGSGSFGNLIKSPCFIQLRWEDGRGLYKGNRSFALERS